MAYEFKKLSDVNVIESTNENAHMLVEQDGEIARIPASSVGGGLPSGGAPYQQLVTDGEGVAKWEEKPFYEKIGEVVIIPETTFVTGQLMGSSGAEVDNPNNLPLEAGKTYMVKWDGVTRSVVAESIEPGSMVILRAGEFDEADNVISGCGIIFQPGTPALFVITPSDHGTEHTLEITTIGNVITKIDSKFMPEGYPRTETKEVEKVYTDLEWMYNRSSLEGLILVEGRNYTVICDGVKYEAPAVYDHENAYIKVVIEPGEEGNSDNKLLFGDETVCGIGWVGGNYPTEIIVKYDEEAIVHLNPKYAPNAVFKSSSYTYMMKGKEIPDGDPIFVCNMSFKDAYAALENGYGLNCMCLAPFDDGEYVVPACWFGGVALIEPGDYPVIIVRFSMQDKTIGVYWTPDELTLA